MDAAEHEKRAGGGEADFDRLARLLRAGIEVEAGIEYADVVGAGIVVDNPQPPAARERNVLGGESLGVLGHRADLFRRSRRANLYRYDLVRQRGLSFARQRAEKRDEVCALRIRQLEPAREILGKGWSIGYAAHVVTEHVFERGERAVMHVGSGTGDLAQSWRLERVLRRCKPQHRSAAAVLPRQTDVVECVIGKGKAAVAFHASRLAGK